MGRAGPGRGATGEEAGRKWALFLLQCRVKPNAAGLQMLSRRHSWWQCMAAACFGAREPKLCCWSPQNPALLPLCAVTLCRKREKAERREQLKREGKLLTGEPPALPRGDAVASHWAA